jgi:hypothetical protein
MNLRTEALTLKSMHIDFVFGMHTLFHLDVS